MKQCLYICGEEIFLLFGDIYNRNSSRYDRPTLNMHLIICVCLKSNAMQKFGKVAQIYFNHKTEKKCNLSDITLTISKKLRFLFWGIFYKEFKMCYYIVGL